MPNVNDIAAVAEALEKCPIRIMGDSCVCVRNRNATCRRCVSACPFHAITVEANEITVAASSCVGCGACITACPTEAIDSTEMSEASLLASACKTARENEGRAVIACARMAAKHIAHPERFVEVPCIARLSQPLILGMIANGCKSVNIVNGNCGTCKYGSCVSGVYDMLEDVEVLMAARGIVPNVSVASEFPDFVCEERAETLYGSTRRGFFSEMATAAKDTAMVAAQTTIEQEFGMVQEQRAIGERLRVGASGSLPTVATPKHDLLLNSFDAIGEPALDMIASPSFATVAIDASRCNACGMCAVFCPTGALKRDEAEKLSSKIEYIEFSASMCVNCGMCSDVCWKSALELSDGISMEQLYDFEPVVFDMPKTGQSSVFGSGF